MAGAVDEDLESGRENQVGETSIDLAAVGGQWRLLNRRLLNSRPGAWQPRANLDQLFVFYAG